MKPVPLAAALLVASACAGVAPRDPMLVPPPPGPAVGYRGFIRASGRNLVDEQGRVFFVRGVGLGNWLLPEGYMWKLDGTRADRPRRIEQLVGDLLGAEKARAFWTAFRANYVTEADVARMAELGFNTVRVAVGARVLMAEDATPSATPVFLEEGFAHLDALVAWGKRHGVYVVIDLHAAPGGQTGANIDDSVADVPELFTSPVHRARAIALWTEIARRYRNEPQVLAYDLLNEPLPKDRFADLVPLLEPFYRDAVAAIRAVDPHHLVTLEGANWANDWSVFGRPFDANVLYQFHKYWNATDRSTIAPYLAFRDRWRVPIWCGEIGENGDDWYRASFAMLEADAVGWSFWPWKKMDATNNPYAFAAPAGWSEIQAHARDPAANPLAADRAEVILGALAEAVKLEHCTFNAKAVAAVFRR
jgi:aryl-phospho-beta-D-glucosidase BglC (GH1 family)